MLTLLVLFLLIVYPVQAIDLDPFNWFIPEEYQVTDHQYSGIKTWSYSSPDGEVIYSVIHSIDSDTQINETYYYGSKQIVVDFSYEHSWISNTYYFQITNETETITGNYSEYSLFPTKKNFVVAYTMDENAVTGLLVYVDLNIIKPGITAEADDLESYQITKVVGLANNYIDLNIQTVTYQAFQESKYETEAYATGKTPYIWLGEVMTIWSTISGLFYNLFWILKTIFVDNIFLTLMFFESFALIYSMQARTIMGWWRRMINYHKGFIEFILKFLSLLVDVIYKIVMAVLKIIKPVG